MSTPLFRSSSPCSSFQDISHSRPLPRNKKMEDLNNLPNASSTSVPKKTFNTLSLPSTSSTSKLQESESQKIRKTYYNNDFKTNESKKYNNNLKKKIFNKHKINSEYRKNDSGKIADLNKNNKGEFMIPGDFSEIYQQAIDSFLLQIYRRRMICEYLCQLKYCSDSTYQDIYTPDTYQEFLPPDNSTPNPYGYTYGLGAAPIQNIPIPQMQLNNHMPMPNITPMVPIIVPSHISSRIEYARLQAEMEMCFMELRQIEENLDPTAWLQALDECLKKKCDSISDNYYNNSSSRSGNKYNKANRNEISTFELEAIIPNVLLQFQTALEEILDTDKQNNDKYEEILKLESKNKHSSRNNTSR